MIQCSPLLWQPGIFFGHVFATNFGDPCWPDNRMQFFDTYTLVSFWNGGEGSTQLVMVCLAMCIFFFFLIIFWTKWHTLHSYYLIFAQPTKQCWAFFKKKAPSSLWYTGFADTLTCGWTPFFTKQVNATYLQRIYLHESEREYADKLLHYQTRVDDMVNQVCSDYIWKLLSSLAMNSSTTSIQLPFAWPDSIYCILTVSKCCFILNSSISKCQTRDFMSGSSV